MCFDAKRSDFNSTCLCSCFVVPDSKGLQLLTFLKSNKKMTKKYRHGSMLKNTFVENRSAGQHHRNGCWCVPFASYFGIWSWE